MEHTCELRSVCKDSGKPFIGLHECTYKDKVKDSTTAQQKEPLIPSPVPDLPWEITASDIFAFEGEHHLLLVDYYFEVTKLKDPTSQETTEVL